MPNSLLANAEYHVGQPGKPAVFLLHGFLQTHQFFTIQRLYEQLATEGYTLLAPTLTLGIPNRKQSLACEAIHTHKVSDDYQELDTWLNWLREQGHQQVILIGHSQGSTELVNYVLRKPSIPISKLIAVSLVEVNVSHDPQENRRVLQELQKKVAQNDRSPLSYPLSFCKKYVGTPESILSYQEWSPTRILESIKKLTIPTTIIMGGADDRLGPDWVERLSRTGKKVRIIDNANHFMDGFNEFDLYEAIQDEITSLN